MGISFIFTIFFVGLVLCSLKKPDLRLEHVAIVHYDPKYVKDPVTFTSRSKRGDTYKTNVTATLLHTWSNNVTGIIYYKNAVNSLEHVLLTAQICEALKLDWIRILIEKYSNIPTSCDIPPKEYHIANLELKPQNFPLILPSGEHYVGLIYALTKSRHVIINLKGTIHVIK